MKNLWKFIISASVAICLIDSIQAADCFFDSIKKLAPDDLKLYSRLDVKNGLIAEGTAKPRWIVSLWNMNSYGNLFACGYTRNWIAEILQGLDSQYDELLLKHNSGWPAAGYQNVTGQKVIDLFNARLNSAKRILYKFQIVGPLDHVWLVEQLANGGGYRVYQSYNNAYSLKAWLTTGDLKSLYGTDIIIWHDVIRMANDFIKPFGASMSNLDNLPQGLLPLKPWLVHIRDYNLTQVEAELKKAWSKIGQGKIMSKQYFYTNYLEVLANLTESIIPFAGTGKLWTRELHDKWTSLFGAPNPVLYPGYAFNTLTKNGDKYALEVKVLEINAQGESNCTANVRILENSLKDCFYSNVKGLSPSDKLLYSRLGKKDSLIASGKSKNDFVNIMNKIKSSGKKFASGYTRSWVTEILQGLDLQYDELLLEKQSGRASAGFVNVTGQKVVDLFNSNLASIKRILYKFQIAGHVWLVEQLPYKGGYRVYQSYNNAYSLKAWLATGDLKSLHGTDIIVWHDVIRMFNDILALQGGSMSNLDNLPPSLSQFKAWLMQIRDYNLTQVEAELKKAQSKFGQGKIVSKDYFYSNYLTVLANLTEAIIPLVGTANNWTQELHDQWISLFGAPNPLLYPGYAFNTWTGRYSQQYSLEVKALKINYTAEVYCHLKSFVLKGSLTDCFYDTVKKLSPYDIQLNSRLKDKKMLMSKGTAKAGWTDKMKKIKSSGTTFVSGYTRSWVAEIPQGLSSQYDELLAKNNSGDRAAGYVDVTGWKVVRHFDSNLDSTKRVIYKLQIVGPLHHVWLVEQLPYNAGYRVYQSYHNAYSLRAWLTAGSLTSLRNHDTMVWHDVVRMITAYVVKNGGSMSDLNNLPVSICTMKPWLEFIQGYNISQVEDNLKIASNKFGQGQIISKDFFYKNYLHVLANMTRDILPLVNTPKRWTWLLHNQWISLFGTPNPSVYPESHFNQLTSGYSQNFALEVKSFSLDAVSEAKCSLRGQVLEKSLHCFFDGVKELSSNDKLLYSRLENKTALIKNSISKAEFVRIMNTIKSTGNTFACGYTRSWMAEILQGLESQYDELWLKINNGTTAAGFVNVTGNKVIDAFNINLGSSHRILYKFQIVGPLDHVWLVEQLPHGKGYRVYQSYNNAYSLKAWLATGGLKSLYGTDIIIWHDVIRMANDFIKPFGASMSNLDNLPQGLLPLKPWLVHIRDYNLTQVEAELKKAWSKIGQGKIMSKQYFYTNYLEVLANLTESVIPFAGTGKLWTRELHDQWTSLFGAPNPVLYPGYAFNTLTKNGDKYALEVKVLKINALAESKCGSRVDTLRRSVERPKPTTKPTQSTLKPTTKIKNPGGNGYNVQPGYLVLVSLFLLLTLHQV